jgi:uncharacterized protein
MNPFVIRGYESADLFCDREKETERILIAIRNKRDITLVSLRKMGKTGLVLHTLEKIRKERSFILVYLDIYHSENLNGFINALATAIFRMKKPASERMKDFLASFRTVRPLISLDQVSGSPTVSFSIVNDRDAQYTLEDLFGLIVRRYKKQSVIIAIDEFQQIAKYPEKNTEALIRGITQSLKNVRFIFSGSNRNMLSRMFGETSRPFYQSTEMMYLEEIDTERYSEFIQRQFKKSSRKIDEKTIREILRITRCHTWYTQYCCNRLYELKRKIEPEGFQEVFRKILLENEPFYFEFRGLVTRYQWQLLKAIANADGAEFVTSGDFIRKFNLTNASTVKRGIDSLTEKEMIYKKGNRYFVYDLFFSRWLEMQDNTTTILS